MTSESPSFQYRTFGFQPVSLLLHDPENPRLPAKIKIKSGDDSDVIQWMLKEANVLELMGAIAQVGFFPGEPLLVVPCDSLKPEGPYYVVEGNRRLTAVQLLLDPNKAKIYKEIVQEISSSAVNKDRLNELPVIIYPQRSEILDYLGYRHVTGIKEWGPPEKVEYLKQLSTAPPYSEMSTSEKHQALARAIGSTSEYVARLLTARELLRVANERSLLNEEDLGRIQDGLTILSTALYYKNIASYINIDPKDTSLDGLNVDEYSQLLSWLYSKGSNKKTVVGESRNLKVLNSVVTNNDAITYLKKTGDLAAANQIAEFENPADNLRSQMHRISDGMELALDMVTKISGLTASDHDIALHIEEQAGILEKRIKKSSTTTV